MFSATANMDEVLYYKHKVNALGLRFVVVRMIMSSAYFKLSNTKNASK